MDKITATIKSKSKFSLPEGGEIVKNDKRMTVKEIENGYVICNSYEIKWKDQNGENHYEYFDREWYSKENPITVKEPKEISLADKF